MLPKTFRYVLLCALTSAAWPLSAQVFDSGSTGVDGALVLDTPGEIVFDPASFAPPLDADGDGVFQFTTVTVGADTTVVFKPTVLGNRPVVWKASGDVTIEGTLNLNGATGHSGINAGGASPAEPGPGGFWGGVGSTTIHRLSEGQGPGGGKAGEATVGVLRHGGGAGHFEAGTTGGRPNSEGQPYGNLFLLPLVGGSGGSGGGRETAGALGSGGGAGGGAILIASSGQLTLNGNIEAKGGNGGQSGVLWFGGGGSGGAIRLVAQSIAGSGTVLATGGTTPVGNGKGSKGRIRVEAFDQDFTGTVDSQARFATPGTPLESANPPTVRVVRVAGVDVPPVPTGSFAPADLSIDEGGEVTFEIEASYVPLGTVVRMMMLSEDGAESVNVDSTPLAGTLEASTATASLTVPPGFSRFSAQASWVP